MYGRDLAKFSISWRLRDQNSNLFQKGRKHGRTTWNKGRPAPHRVSKWSLGHSAQDCLHTFFKITSLNIFKLFKFSFSKFWRKKWGQTAWGWPGRESQCSFFISKFIQRVGNGCIKCFIVNTIYIHNVVLLKKDTMPSSHAAALLPSVLATNPVQRTPQRPLKPLFGLNLLRFKYISLSHALFFIGWVCLG